MSDNPQAIRLLNRKTETRRITKTEIADYHLSSFEFCRQRGEIGQSFSNLSLAFCVLPSLKSTYYSSYLEVFESWSAVVEENYGFKEALTLYEVALKHFPESADLNYLLAKILYRHGSIYEAWSYSCMAHSECPQDPNAQETRGRLTNALINRWHLPMLNDLKRNSSFKSAIEEAVKQGHDEVLDIGSGTGLLSIFAKWAGAKQVYGCDVDKFMCEIAHSILQSNVRTNNIRIYNLHSQDLIISSHIPKKVSLVVSEIVDAGLFGEHILSTLQHAWTHLLLPPISAGPVPNDAVTVKTSVTVESHKRPSGRRDNQQKDLNVRENDALLRYGKVIPSKAEVFVALINCNSIAKCTKLDNPDLLYFKNKKVLLKLDEPYMSEKLSQIPGGFKLLSVWTPVTKVDFNCPIDIDRHLKGVVNKTLELVCISEGTPDALVLAFNLHLDDTHCISTFPEVGSAAWENAVYPVSEIQKLSLHDVVKVEFNCHGIINLSVQCQSPMETNTPNEMLFLSANALAFLNRKIFINNFLSAAEQIALQLKDNSESNMSHNFVICDTTPFPIAGLSVMSLFPNAHLYVEEESILKALEEIGVNVKLCEDLEEEVDLLFIWPVTKEGTLKDGIIKKILMYRLMMAEGGLVFPQRLDLIIDAINSSELCAMTQVDDSNTCGVKVAEVFNIAKTSHQVDVHLDTLPHTSVVSEPIPILRLSLTTGEVEGMGSVCNNTEDNMLILGGDVVTVFAKAIARQSSIITALPYWFILEADLNSRSISLSTRDPDSPCNQSLLALDEYFNVVDGKPFGIKIIWREGIFNVKIQSTDGTSYLPL